jgi:hypothetical protein
VEGIWDLRERRQSKVRWTPTAAEYGIAIIGTQQKPVGNINAGAARLIFCGARGC